MKIRFRQNKYNSKLSYNYTTFIYIDNLLNEKMNETYINSYEKLDTKILADFIEKHFLNYGWHVLGILYGLISDYLFEDKDNFKLSIKNNKQLLEAIAVFERKIENEIC